MKIHPSHNADIINYYYTNYTQCNHKTPFFATWQFLAYFSHSVFVVQVPLVVLTGYCILRKTPKEMGSLKWAMLNVHIWSTLMDALICTMETPYLYFPALAGFSLGLLQVLGVPESVQAFLATISIGFVFSSIAALFENRSSSFQMNRFRFERNSTRFAFQISNGVIYSLLIIPVYLNIPDQNEAKMFVLRQIECPTEEFFTFPIFVLLTDPSWLHYQSTVMIVQGVIMITASVFFISCTTYYIYFADKSNYSAKTRKLQRMFFIGNLVQIAIPSSFYAFPFFCLMLIFVFQYNNQSLNNIGFAFLSLHNLAAMIAVLAIHHPYRAFVMSILRTSRREKVASAQISHVLV